MFKLHRPGVAVVLMAAVFMLTLLACGGGESVVQEVEVTKEVEVEVTREVDRDVE